MALSKRNLNTAKKTIKELQESHRIALTAANLEKNNLKEELLSANRGLAGANAKLERDLLAETRLRESKEAALEIKRQELVETRAEADAQTKTYELTFERMSEELKAAQHEAEQANLKVNEETNQRDQFIRLYHENDQQLAVWKPVIEHAKAQAAQIDEWVRMKQAVPGKPKFVANGALQAEPKHC